MFLHRILIFSGSKYRARTRSLDPSLADAVNIVALPMMTRTAVSPRPAIARSSILPSSLLLSCLRSSTEQLVLFSCERFPGVIQWRRPRQRIEFARPDGGVARADSHHSRGPNIESLQSRGLLASRLTANFEFYTLACCAPVQKPPFRCHTSSTRDDKPVRVQILE